MRDDLDDVAGIVLAGGRGSRMGGADKALLMLQGRPLVAHVITRLGCARAISANGDPARFAGFGLPVLADPLPDHPGPLAGVLAGLDWAAARGVGQIVTAAVDTPFFPPDLALRLARAARVSGAAVVLAQGYSDGDSDGRGVRVQPTFGLWCTALAAPLRAALLDGQRRIEAVAQQFGATLLPVEGERAFFNINRPEDLTAAGVRP